MLTMQINFAVTSGDDAIRASRIMARISEEYSGPEADTLDTPHSDSVQRVSGAATRPRNTRRTGTAPVDPVAAYNALAEQAGSPKVEEIAPRELAESETLQGEVLPPASVTADTAENTAPLDQIEPEPAASMSADPHDDKAPAAGEPVSEARTGLIAQARDKARKEGALWLRGVITKYHVTALPALTNRQLREVIA